MFANLWSFLQAAGAALTISRQPVAPPVQGWQAFSMRLKHISGRLLASDLLATTVLIVMAGLLGVQTLWINDLTWGGWEDWVVALLWGLGLHQAGFTGLDALRQSFAK